MSAVISWTDRVVEEITKRKRKEYVCEGMWSPSGFFHIGNARSEIFTPYAVYRALKDKGFKARQNFIIDDFDPITKVPEGLGIKKSEENKFLGIPCALAPSPIKGYKNWAGFFVSQIRDAIDRYGIDLNIISAYETYKKGRFNDLIIYSLNHSREIVAVWNEIAGSDKSLSFIPVQVLCEKCGKLTEGKRWDRKKVYYNCRCGNNSAISPLNGKAKLHWRVHWVAHWILHDVCFESAGKDHFSKGGSVDVGHALIRRVFKRKPPYQIPTEFILLRGAKMAGSVGNVIDLKEWLSVASPELFRFLNFSYKPASSIEFSLTDNSFLLLMERFERAERIFYGLEKAENKKIEEKIKRAYKLSAIETMPKKLSFQLPYSFAILIAQLVKPEKELGKAMEILQNTGHITKKLNENDKKKLREKLVRAGNWVQKYAPKEFRIQFIQYIPKEAKKLPIEMKRAFKEIAKKLPKTRNADEIQQLIFDSARKNNVQAKDLFKFLYLSILGRERGPRAASLILAIGKEKIIKRLRELAEDL